MLKVEFIEFLEESVYGQQSVGILGLLSNSANGHYFSLCVVSFCQHPF